MAGPLAFFIGTIVAIPVIIVLLYFLKDRPTFSLSCRIFNGRVLVLSDDPEALDTMKVYVPKSLREKIKSGEMAAATYALVEALGKFMEKINVVEHLNHVHVHWRAPRSGIFPAIEDVYYLQRRLVLGLGRPTSEELQQKQERGEYDGTHFWASGMCSSPTQIECTWFSSGLPKTAYLYELTNAVVWKLKGENFARAEGSDERQVIDKAVAAIKLV
jgi:hypothetical protein